MWKFLRHLQDHLVNMKSADHIRGLHIPSATLERATTKIQKYHGEVEGCRDSNAWSIGKFWKKCTNYVARHSLGLFRSGQNKHSDGFSWVCLPKREYLSSKSIILLDYLMLCWKCLRHVLSWSYVLHILYLWHVCDRNDKLPAKRKCIRFL